MSPIHAESGFTLNCAALIETIEKTSLAKYFFCFKTKEKKITPALVDK